MIDNLEIHHLEQFEHRMNPASKMNDKRDVEMIGKYLPTTTPQYLHFNLKYSWGDTVSIRLMRSSGVRIIFTVYCLFDFGVGTKFTKLFDDSVQNKHPILLNRVSFLCITVKTWWTNLWKSPWMPLVQLGILESSEIQNLKVSLYRVKVYPLYSVMTHIWWVKNKFMR